MKETRNYMRAMLEIEWKD